VDEASPFTRDRERCGTLFPFSESLSLTRALAESSFERGGGGGRDGNSLRDRFDWDLLREMRE
jgi:hypothetical protein